LDLSLFVSGSHLSPEFGRTAVTIEEDGFPVAARIEMLLSSDSPEGIAKSMGLGIVGFAQAFGAGRPDILLVYGDRFEMHAAALAALPFRIPVAHIHGGEVTEGAIDESLRHSITKLSHLHFTATQDYARRVVQMGEEPWRVSVSGAPTLDNLQTMRIPGCAEIGDRIGMDLAAGPLLVTFHPATLEYDLASAQMADLLAVLHASQLPVVFTMPNADTGGRVLRERIGEFVAKHPIARAVESLGTEHYFGLMRLARAMVGNSSSGIIEAPSFGLPVVNIGSRQRGRTRGANVIDVGVSQEEIARGLEHALDPVFREGLRGCPNPYGDGHAAERIVSRLASVHLGSDLITKRFHDLPGTGEGKEVR
jgi:UDP-hydrolysing UDP-N-acetyl-D-glucosamine 2-epimerase